MPAVHKLQKENGDTADVGTVRFTTSAAHLLPGLPSLTGTPCWECGQPIDGGQVYYVAAVWRARSVMSSPALVHAEHVD